MGDYITTTDLQTRVGGAVRAAQLTTKTGSTPDTTLMTNAVTEAEGQMNAYLAQRYPVPVDVSSYPGLTDWLGGCALDLAEYNLRALRASIPPDITKRYEQRIQELKDIAAGEAALPVDAAPDSGKYAFLRYAPGAEDML